MNGLPPQQRQSASNLNMKYAPYPNQQPQHQPRQKLCPPSDFTQHHHHQPHPQAPPPITKTKQQALLEDSIAPSYVLKQLSSGSIEDKSSQLNSSPPQPPQISPAFNAGEPVTVRGGEAGPEMDQLVNRTGDNERSREIQVATRSEGSSGGSRSRYNMEGIKHMVSDWLADNNRDRATSPRSPPAPGPVNQDKNRQYPMTADEARQLDYHENQRRTQSRTSASGSYDMRGGSGQNPSRNHRHVELRTYMNSEPNLVDRYSDRREGVGPHHVKSNSNSAFTDTRQRRANRNESEPNMSKQQQREDEQYTEEYPSLSEAAKTAPQPQKATTKGNKGDFENEPESPRTALAKANYQQRYREKYNIPPSDPRETVAFSRFGSKPRVCTWCGSAQHQSDVCKEKSKNLFF